MGRPSAKVSALDHGDGQHAAVVLSGKGCF